MSTMSERENRTNLEREDVVIKTKGNRAKIGRVKWVNFRLHSPDTVEIQWATRHWTLPRVTHYDEIGRTVSLPKGERSSGEAKFSTLKRYGLRKIDDETLEELRDEFDRLEELEEDEGFGATSIEDYRDALREAARKGEPVVLDGDEIPTDLGGGDAGDESDAPELPSREEIEERARQKEVHLKNDLGLDKGTLKRKARRDGIYGPQRYADVCDLLDEHRQTYTIEEARKIVNNVVSTSHDFCVAENPEDFHRFAVEAAEKNIEKRDRIDDELIEMREREKSRILAGLQDDVWDVLRDDERVAADLEGSDDGESGTGEPTDRERAELARERAREQTAKYPQYDGAFEDWVPVRVTSEVETKLGVAFVEGEISIAAPESRPHDAWSERSRVVWSSRNGIKTEIPEAAVEEL